MSRMLRNKGLLEAFIVIVVVVFATSGMASSFDSGRIIPKGKVLIYRGDKQVGELTAEAPFPDGALLACEGDCAARLNDLLLVGVDKSMFSVTTKSNSRELLVQEGTVYFALSKMPGTLVFVTPKGAATAQQLILNAAADQGLVKGYVTVTDELAEIGVIEGGSVLFTTLAGETTLQAGNKIVLAQAESSQTTEESTGAKTEGSSGEAATGTAGGTGGGVAIAPIAAGVALAAGVGIAAATSGGGGNGGGGVSVSAP